MRRVLRCPDYTGSYCNFVICGQTRDEVLNNAEEHMNDFHNKEFSKELYEKATKGIREADCEKEIRTDRILLF